MGKIYVQKLKDQFFIILFATFAAILSTAIFNLEGKIFSSEGINLILTSFIVSFLGSFVAFGILYFIASKILED